MRFSGLWIGIPFNSGKIGNVTGACVVNAAITGLTVKGSDSWSGLRGDGVLPSNEGGEAIISSNFRGSGSFLTGIREIGGGTEGGYLNHVSGLFISGKRLTGCNAAGTLADDGSALLTPSAFTGGVGVVNNP